MVDRPMLAASLDRSNSFEDLNFPLLATPKIDGVRALIVRGRLVSRSFRPISNVALCHALEALLPEGADGEVSCGSLYDTTSIVMSEGRTIAGATFNWFDWAYDLDAPYGERAAAIRERSKTMNQSEALQIHSNIGLSAKPISDWFTRCAADAGVKVVPLIPNRIDSARELERYEAAMLARGYEGVVVRSPQGRYKCGRSTISEGLMIKIKREEDYEAVVVGTEELMHNLNEAQADNFGNTKRGSAKANLAPGGTLGAIVAQCEAGTFRVGTGFSASLRDALWANRDAIIGQLVKYRCAGWGKKGVPRSPVFAGIRHQDDAT